ncbi:MAG TPA: NAD(P)-dependent oxidoreductase [Ohtaekwangia sp.]|nr:NAD(P)-dependent oxidoreductase [Ohtaekwangia sp.]
MRKCLIVDSMHESLFAMLTEIGWAFEYLPEIQRDEIKKIHRGYDGLIIRSKTQVDYDLLGDHPTIRFIGRAGAGIDNLDVAYLNSKGIHILHASEGNRDAVGEYTVGALLGLLRNIPKANNEVREMIWHREENRGEEIMGKTVSIVGYGNMGQSFARRISGFGCNILAYDKYKTNYSDAYATESTMETLWEQTDILSLHIPLTVETRQMVNEFYLKRFKKNIVFINTARGEIVSLNDLNEQLKAKKVRGAVLDVLENEKLSLLTPAQLEVFNSLRERSDVILTPHIAGWTFESHVKINVALISKIKVLHLD